MPVPSYKKKVFVFCIFQINEEKKSEPELDPDPDPLVRGTDPDPHQNVTDPHH